MASWYFRKKVGLKSASLATLESEIAKLETRISYFETEGVRASNAERELQRLRVACAEVDARISSLMAVRQVRPGLLGSLLKLTEIPQGVRREIDSLTQKSLGLQREQQRLAWENRRNANSSAALESCQQRLEKLRDEVARRKRKRDSAVELRAAAAANSDEVRSLAKSVRRELKQQPFCPYCGGPLGDEPHADHIYPVSKGGRSVPRNMVFACSPCNGMKSDLTLASFVRKFNLDRLAIERRLEQLDKEF